MKLFGPEGGSIINIGSGVSRITPATTAVYTATKGALDAITGVLAKELGPRKIRVNSINPGMIETEGVRSAGFSDSDFRKWVEAQAPLGRIGQTDDIAPTAVCLAREATIAAGLNAEFALADFLRSEPPQQFDWVFEHTLFCAIQPDERPLYCQSLLRWLKPQGYYLAVNYLIPDKEGPPFGTTREELWNRFSGDFELLEEWVPRSYPNRTGLERMFWWKRRAS